MNHFQPFVPNFLVVLGFAANILVAEPRARECEQIVVTRGLAKLRVFRGVVLGHLEELFDESRLGPLPDLLTKAGPVLLDHDGPAHSG